jgi:hypothetical protein
MRSSERIDLLGEATISFLNELATERKTVLKTFVSVFNELSIEKKKYAHGSGLNP